MCEKSLISEHSSSSAAAVGADYMHKWYLRAALHSRSAVNYWDSLSFATLISYYWPCGLGDLQREEKWQELRYHFDGSNNFYLNGIILYHVSRIALNYGNFRYDRKFSLSSNLWFYVSIAADACWLAGLLS